MMQRGRPLSLTGQALRLLSQREHSRTELERKLAAPFRSFIDPPASAFCRMRPSTPG